MCDVLLLDDDALIRWLLAETLRDAGFAVSEAANGAEAMACVRSLVAPRLLVTDLHLGEADNGIDVATEARECVPCIPVIFITGRPDAMSDYQLDDRERLIAKPFMPQQLVAAVQSLLAQSRAPC